MIKQSQRGLSRRNFISGASVALAVPFFVRDAVSQNAKGTAMKSGLNVPITISDAVAQQVPRRTLRRIESQVRLACSNLQQATATNNLEAINQIIADEVTFVDFDGRARNKKEMLAYNAEMQNKGLYRNLKVDNQSVTVVAADTAVLTAQISMEGKDVEGRDVTGKFRAVHIFADKQGVWQVVTVKMIKIS
jgi:ketosteroid isomerase-like protein